MGYTRTSRGTWYQEQAALINSASKSELKEMSTPFDAKFEAACNTISANHGNKINIMRDAKKMADDENIMLEYKTEFLMPIIDEIKNAPVSTESERQHLEDVAFQLEQAWDASASTFIQEATYTTSYLPLSTLDFPALIKQYIRFLGKEIMPVQTASSTNIEQRIFTKYLVNNQTGEEYEVPRIYFEKDADGTPKWKKLYNAGRGYRINPTVITLADIHAATNKKYSLYTHLLDDDGTALTITPTVRNRISYDFAIRFVNVTVPDTSEGASAGATKTVKVKLPGNGIDIDLQTGGVFLNGGITTDMKLPVVDATTNAPTGEVVSISDRLSGVVDFIKGTVTATSCGTITGIFCEGHVSNEVNTRTIGFREYPEIRKWLINDEVRFQLPFTVEDFKEANASLNFNLYNRLVQELVVNQEMFEDESILEYLDTDFDECSGYNSNAFDLESYMHTEYADLDPTSLSPNFAGDPWEYRTNAIHNAICSTIYELCDRGKYDNMSFVVYGNPKAVRLLQKFVTWTTQKGTELGGVVMNHAFGMMTDTDVPIRVVSSNRIDAYKAIPAYQEGASETDLSREYFFKIVAYPMDKNHITYKHLKFARHLTNSPENGAYADAQNPGGAAVIVNATSQYKTVKIQGIQGLVICKNSVLAPDSKAGLVVGTIGG